MSEDAVDELMKNLQNEAKAAKSPKKIKTIIDKQRFVTSNSMNNTTLLKQSQIVQHHKPIEPYNPNAFRSRLPVPDTIQPYKNTSSIVLGNTNRSYFTTINHNVYKNPQRMYKATTNQDINSRNNVIAKKNVFEK